MSSLPPKFESTTLGFIYRSESLLVFFGKKTADVDSIKNNFPTLHFQYVKQTHSDLVVSASDQLVEADSHFTSKLSAGLLIKTADCIPAMIYCHQTKRVAAVHAGWKGVANQILLKTLKKLIATGSTDSHFEIWIGPHILQSSFEIDLDVLKQLELATYKLNRHDYCYEENSKYFVNLNQIVVSQIFEATGRNIPTYFIDFDTKTNDDFWSFRRDKEKAGRNLSFIATG